MPVTDQTTSNSSTGNGVTTVFPYTFKILDEADILVEVDGVAKTLTTHYTVSGVGVSGGGNVTFVTAPASGAVVALSRSMAYSRETDYQENGDLLAATLDDDVDRSVMLAQQVRQLARRAVKLPSGVTTDQVLATGNTAAERIGKVIGFDSAGDPALLGTADIDTALVTAFAATLLDDTTAATARSTLGAAASGTNTDITALGASVGVAVKGVPNAGDVTAGNVGEYVESVVGSTSAPASGAYGDLTSITLTGGDWDLSAIVTGELNGATLTAMSAGIGLVTGNNGSGLVYGDTAGDFLPTTANRDGITVPPKRVRLASTTTYYLKMLASYSAGTPKFYGRISARRMR